MRLKYNDRVHGYWLKVEKSEGGNGRSTRCKGVTSVAKVPDDTRNLEQWRARNLAIGLARTPHLVESIAAHHTDRTKLDELCEAALKAAGSDSAAEYGTSVHRITERLDLAEEIISTPTVDHVRRVWSELLPAAGLTIEPEYTERVVVYPERLLCGKLDRFARRPDGSLVVIDVKTGSMRYPHSMAIQLALYANAPLLAARWEGLDGETDQFEAMPSDVNPEVGYIVSIPPVLPDVAPTAAVYEIDLLLGKRCIEEIVLPTLRWRAVKPEALIRPVATWAA